MSRPTTRIALIGAGYIAAYHARGVIECEHSELAYVVSRSGRTGDRLVGAIGGGTSTTEVDLALQDSDVDAVVVASPNGLHEKHVIAALEAGKAVLVEKPMATSVAAAERIVAVAKRTGGYLQVGHMWRHDIEAANIRAAIAGGAVGRVYRTVSYGVHERWGPGGWFTEPDAAGGGALLDMGVHAIDTTRYLLGDPFPVSVYARISTQHAAIGVDDTALLLVTWDDGTVSTIESGWWQPKAEGPEAATRLYGTQGFASLFPTYWESIDMQAPRGEDGQYPDPSCTRPIFPRRREHCEQRMYTAQIDAFVTAVAEHRERIGHGEFGVGTTDRSRQPWEPGIVVMRIVDAAYRSADTGQAVLLSQE